MAVARLALDPGEPSVQSIAACSARLSSTSGER